MIIQCYLSQGDNQDYMTYFVLLYKDNVSFVNTQIKV